jgi:hypothetical protein
MDAHTPGPWTIHWQEPMGDYVIKGAPGRVLSIRTGVLPMSSDARLIAAAPRMLALLEHVPHVHEMVERVTGCPGCEARAILSEVEGNK